MDNLTLIEKIKKYEEITKEIDLILEFEYELIEEKINERQIILESISDKDRMEANKIYFELKLDKIDERIREKIINSINNVKQEINEYRKAKTVNSMYSRNSTEKLNIFSKKV